MISSVKHRAGATPSMIVGGVIKRVREERQLTQAALAERLNLPASTLSRIEKGTYNCTVEQLMSIASGLGTPSSELMREIEHTVAYVRNQGLLAAPKTDSDLSELLLGAAAITALILAAKK